MVFGAEISAVHIAFTTSNCGRVFSPNRQKKYSKKFGLLNHQ